MTPEEHLAAALRALGYPEPDETGVRFGGVLREFAPGAARPPIETFPAPGGRVVLRDLPFHSLCEHHLLPFFGTVDIAYSTHGRAPGLGAVPRLVRHHARRPQLQERMTDAIARDLCAELGEAGVVVRVRARQMCMELRGPESPGTVVTEAHAGVVGPELVALL
jgi:GTP cyclohydrolase IA